MSEQQADLLAKLKELVGKFDKVYQPVPDEVLLLGGSADGQRHKLTKEQHKSKIVVVRKYQSRKTSGYAQAFHSFHIETVEQFYHVRSIKINDRIYWFGLLNDEIDHFLWNHIMDILIEGYRRP